MCEFDQSKSMLLGPGGQLRVPDGDEVTRKLAMLIEGECGGLGPSKAAEKYGYCRQRYFQLRKAFESGGALALANKKRGPKTNYRGTHQAVKEVIQDALFQTPTMLFQTDEIDGMLQSINKAKDARHEAIMGTMLTMYSSDNSVYPMRRKAGKESPGVIDQPCLVIYGTAIPNHYYQALSERMLTNGFFARMIILEAGPRAPGQEPSIRDLPPRVLATAQSRPA